MISHYHPHMHPLDRLIDLDKYELKLFLQMRSRVNKNPYNWNTFYALQL